MSHIKAHTDSQAATGAQAMGAEAFTAGEHVAFAGTPSLHTAAHEAAHVVQQRAGVHLTDGVGKTGDVYEQHANAVAARVVARESAVDLLSASPSGSSAGHASVQRQGPGEASDRNTTEKREEPLPAGEKKEFQPEAGSWHDYSEKDKQALGEGDEVLKPGADPTNVKPSDVKVAFPATPDGVVQAALYELHRGELRSLAEIDADETSAKFQRGPGAATEGSAKANTDAVRPKLTVAQIKAGFAVPRGTYATEKLLQELEAKHARTLVLLSNGEIDKTGELKKLKKEPNWYEVQAILDTRSMQSGQQIATVGSGKKEQKIGGVQTALAVGFSHSKAKGAETYPPWCGSFVAYIYARCGINVGKGFASALKTPGQLAKMEGSIAYFRPDTGKNKKTYEPSGDMLAIDHHPDASTKPQDVPLKGNKVTAWTAEALDVRPGDVAWLMHTRSSGHVMLVVAVVHREDGVDLVTIEGNAGSQLQAVARHIGIKDGKLTGDIAGWGRPPELAQAEAPDDNDDEAAEEFIAERKGVASPSTN